MVSSGLLWQPEAFFASFGPRVGTRSYQPTLSHVWLFLDEKSGIIYLLLSDVFWSRLVESAGSLLPSESKVVFKAEFWICAGSVWIIAHKDESFVCKRHAARRVFGEDIEGVNQAAATPQTAPSRIKQSGSLGQQYQEAGNAQRSSRARVALETLIA